METAQNELLNARKRLFKEEIEADDYSVAKEEYNAMIDRLEALIYEKSKTVVNIEKDLEKVVSNMCRLDEIYLKPSVKSRRELIGYWFDLPRKNRF